MNSRIATYSAGAALFALALAQAPEAANAKSFKAKYYKECYAGVADVAPLVTPKESLSKKASKLGGLFGSVGSFAGIGGAGGSMVKAADTVNKVNKYSKIIDDVGGFTSQMRTDHPDPNDRFAAYGDHMSSEAQDLAKVTSAVSASQSCYEQAYDELARGVNANEIKKSKAKKYLKEIQKGTQASGDVLLLAASRLNQNLQSYDQALASEKPYMANGMHTMAAQGALQNVAYSNKLPVSASVGAAHFGTLSGLAGFATAKAESASQTDTNANDYAGLQALASSSQKYLELNEEVRETAEKQRLLELKVNRGL